jgi:hypothetical protein
MYSNASDITLATAANTLSAELDKFETMPRHMRRSADDYAAEMREQGEALVEDAAARGLVAIEALAARTLARLEAALA